MDIFSATVGELHQRHRRINVVEGGDATRVHGDPVAQHGAVRHERAEYDKVGIRDQRAEATRYLLQRAIELDAAEWRAAQVAVLAIPGDIAFEERHRVTARRKR